MPLGNRQGHREPPIVALRWLEDVVGPAQRGAQKGQTEGGGGQKKLDSLLVLIKKSGKYIIAGPGILCSN